MLNRLSKARTGLIWQIGRFRLQLWKQWLVAHSIGNAVLT
jgi:hypothetical protein